MALRASQVSRNIISSPTEDSDDDVFSTQSTEPWPNFPEKDVLNLSNEDLKAQHVLPTLIYALSGIVANNSVNTIKCILDVFYANEVQLFRLRQSKKSIKDPMVQTALENRQELIKSIMEELCVAPVKQTKDAEEEEDE